MAWGSGNRPFGLTTRRPRLLGASKDIFSLLPLCFVVGADSKGVSDGEAVVAAAGDEEMVWLGLAGDWSVLLPCEGGDFEDRTPDWGSIGEGGTSLAVSLSESASLRDVSSTDAFRDTPRGSAFDAVSSGGRSGATGRGSELAMLIIRTQKRR